MKIQTEDQRGLGRDLWWEDFQFGEISNPDQRILLGARYALE